MTLSNVSFDSRTRPALHYAEYEATSQNLACPESVNGGRLRME